MSLQTLPVPEVYQGGSGTPLVLLHGLGGSWRAWLPVLSLLEPHHRVIAVTLPGHPGGLPSPLVPTTETIADTLAAQLRGLGLERAHIVGQSFGGLMAVEMTRRGLAVSTLAISPAGAWKDHSYLLKLINKVRASLKILPYIRPLLSLMATFTRCRKLLLKDEMENGDRVSAAELRDILRRGAGCTFAQKLLVDTFPQVEALPPGAVTPVRVVWCEHDKVIPFAEYGRPFLDRLGLPELPMLANTGHNPMYDDPAGVARAILDQTKLVDANRAPQ